MIDHDKLDTRWQVLQSEGPRTEGVVPEYNPLLAPPDWYDAERFRKAQKLAKKYYFSLNIAHFIGNILLVHLPDVLIPVLATGHSASPFAVFKRILSTVVHILSWYEQDPFDPTTQTHQSLLTVRRNCHMAVSRLMNRKYPRAPQRYWLSQFDMVMTQWSLIGIVAIRPRECGFYGTTREEFEEYIYFWRVMGHCVGIQDRFNCCLDGSLDESVEYLDICYRRCYKVHLDRQCEAVKIGMALTEGVFMGINAVIPRWVISFEGYMKYWYDSLGVRHPIQLDRWDTRLSYKLWCFIVDYVLQVRIAYHLITWVYLFMLRQLFKHKEYVERYIVRHYGHVVYRLRDDYHLDPYRDLNNNVEESKENDEHSVVQYYQVDNHVYKPNVS